MNDEQSFESVRRVEEVRLHQLNIRLELGWVLLGVAVVSDGDPRSPSQHFLYSIGWKQPGAPVYPPGIRSRDRSL
jgi:hypothetical protein